MGATEALREDHRLAWRLESVITGCADALEAGADVPIGDIARISDVIGGFLDAVHHSREEDTYFPCAAAYGMGAQIRTFLIEHEFGRRVAARVAEHAARWRAGEDAREPVARFLRAYAVFLRDHMTKEEKFFEEAEAALSAEEEAEMLGYFGGVSMAAGAARRAENDIAALEASAWFASSLRSHGGELRSGVRNMDDRPAVLGQDDDRARAPKDGTQPRDA